MHVAAILKQLLKSAIHKSRTTSLIPIITALITSKQLQLTKLGRSLDTAGKERAGIRRIDRMLGNKYYQQNSIDFYECIIRNVIVSNSRPKIIVDWTGLPNSKRATKLGEQCALRASLVAEGRSITLYEEVHPKKNEGNPLVHKNFLKKFKSIIPADCSPIIVTDAGFKNPWFKLVKSFGWDYVGRTCGDICYDDGSGFKKLKSLFEKATLTPKFLGQMILTKGNTLKTNFYICKHKLKGRTKCTHSGKRDNTKDSNRISRGYREPWILVSSIGGHYAAKKVVKIYKARMTIEESIRDTKSTKTGFNLNDNITIKAERYAVWLMISALASFIAWIVGYTAEKRNLHLDFQANTYPRRTLSFFYLGCQIIRKKIPMYVDLKIIQKEAWGNDI